MDENLPIIVVATKDAMYNKMVSVVQQLCARLARLIIIANEGDSELRLCTNANATFIEVHEGRFVGGDGVFIVGAACCRCSAADY